MNRMLRSLCLIVMVALLAAPALGLDRISGTTATQERKFTEGNRNSTPKVPATVVTSSWLNGVQEELVGVVEAAGLTPSASDNTQLADAIDITVSAHADLTSPHSATSAATALRVMLRDASGRAKVAAPSASDDIARKAEVDAHVNSASPHSATFASYWSTGDLKVTLKSVADVGWIMANDGTIGSATSGASTRAHADCEALFLLIWTNIGDATAPVYGGRGVSAAADWAANKRIQVGTILGRALISAGAGAGLTARPLGSVVGAETHQLMIDEMPAHKHTFNGQNSNIFGDTDPNTHTGLGLGGLTSYRPMDETGGNTPHNNMQPSVAINLMIKL